MNVYSRQKIIFAKQYCLKVNGQCGFKFTEIPAKILQLNLKSITGFLSYFCQLKTGLGTLFFSVQNVPFFSILKRERNVLFPSFWRFMKPKRTLRSFPCFSKEWKRMERT